MASETWFEATLREGTLFLEDTETAIEVGSLDEVVELLGGEMYSIEYSDRQASVAWLSTDEDNTITFDVRECLLEIPYSEESVEQIASCPLGETGVTGFSKRIEHFTDLVTELWDTKGTVGNE